MPIGFGSVTAYIEHRKRLEMMPVPALHMVAGGGIEFDEPYMMAQDKPLMMERFVVPIGNNGMIGLIPFSQTDDDNGPALMVKIEFVREGSPFYKKGIRKGLVLRRWQGVNLSGLTRSEIDTLVRTPITSDLQLELAENPQSRTYEIVISRKSFPLVSKVASSNP